MRRFLGFVLALVAAPAAVLGAGQAALAGHQDAATAAALAAAAGGGVVGWFAGRVGMALREFSSPQVGYRRGWFGGGGWR
jgi:hypothetical protein